MKDLKKLSMNIVNQLFDEAEVPVETRQKINDTCDEFVEKILKDLYEDFKIEYYIKQS